MKFLFGVACGVLGMWAYQGGKLQSLIGGAPEPVQQVFTSATQRVQQAVNSDQARDVASNMQDTLQRVMTPSIATPSAAEVSGRPSAPLPRQEPEGVHIETP